MEILNVRMLGEFSLQLGENKISDNDNRTRKIWVLLACLICQRGRVVPARKLIELLWGEEPASSNPENALRITFHRARSLLNQLWPTAGRDLILYRDNGYTWNEAVPAVLDFEEFDRLCSLKTDDPQEKLRAGLEALKLYQGDFLEKQSSETWVIPISTHYHNQYITLAMEMAEILSQAERHGEAAYICRKAIASEPYHEPLHQMLIGELAAQGDVKGAGAVYETLSKRLMEDFGIHPSDQTREIYREAAFSPGERPMEMDQVMEHIQEKDHEPGAMQCDYDYFKLLCHVESRSMERNEKITHIALLSVGPSGEKPLTKRSLNRIMEQLGSEIGRNLRRGDVFSKCSASQYILMLPRANYENSCMVCRRVLGAFNRAHPQTSAKFHYRVQTLSPRACVP